MSLLDSSLLPIAIREEFLSMLAQFVESATTFYTNLK